MFESKKEKRVREKVIEHLSQTRECIKAAHETFLSYLRGDIRAAKKTHDQVVQHERAGDKLRRDIYQLLSEGAFLPILRADLHNLVAEVDELAGLGEDLCDMLLGERPKWPAKFHKPLKEIFGKTISQLLDLERLMGDFFSQKRLHSEQVREKIQNVSKIEYEIDGIEWEITVSLFKSRMPLANKMHAKNFLTQMTILSNKIEDISDTLSELQVKLQV